MIIYNIAGILQIIFSNHFFSESKMDNFLKI